MAADRDVSQSARARELLVVTTVEDAEATLDPALKVQIVKVAITTEETMPAFSVEIAVVKEEDREVVREEVREEADITTMTDLITPQRVEDLRLLVVVPETITIMMTIDLVKDTTIKIMTIPAKIELAEATSTTTRLVAEDPLNSKIIMITHLAMITEDHLSKIEEATTIKTIV